MTIRTLHTFTKTLLQSHIVTCVVDTITATARTYKIAIE